MSASDLPSAAVPAAAEGAAADDAPAPASVLVTARGRMLARNGSIRLRVVFQSDRPIAREAFDGDEVIVSGPGGAALPADLRDVRARRGGTRLVALYRATAPAGGPDGASYTLRLTDAAAAEVGVEAGAMRLGGFTVSPGARVLRLAPPAAEPEAPEAPAPLPPDDYVQPPSNEEDRRPLPPANPAQHPQGAEALRQAAERMRVDIGELTIELMEGAVWSDGSLGGAITGGPFTAAIEPGYRIVISGAGRKLEYHTAAREGTGANDLRRDVHLYGPPDAARADHPAAAAARQVAAERLGVPAAEVEVLSVGDQVWTDADLGWPGPGIRTEDVPGYVVIVAAAGERVVYHTDENGSVVKGFEPLRNLRVDDPAAQHPSLAWQYDYVAERLGVDRNALTIESIESYVSEHGPADDRTYYARLRATVTAGDGRTEVIDGGDFLPTRAPLAELTEVHAWSNRRPAIGPDGPPRHLSLGVTLRNESNVVQTFRLRDVRLSLDPARYGESVAGAWVEDEGGRRTDGTEFTLQPGETRAVHLRADNVFPDDYVGRQLYVTLDFDTQFGGQARTRNAAEVFAAY